MSKYLDAIHEAIGGDYTDTCYRIEEAAIKLAEYLDWYRNAPKYREAAFRQIRALVKIEGSEHIRECISHNVLNSKPYDIDEVQKIIDSGKIVKMEELFEE